MQNSEDRRLAELGKLARQVYEVISLFQRQGRDATRRRIANRLQSELEIPKTEVELFAQGVQVRALVDKAIRELRQKKLVKQRIDAWVLLHLDSAVK